MAASRPRPEAEAFLFWGLLGLLLWVPIPLGSNRPWAWMILEVWTFALLGAWLACWALGGARVPEVVRRAWPAWLLLGGWIVLHVAHVVPLPAGLVAVLSPEAARIHALPAQVGAEAGWITLSLEPQASQGALLKTLAYVGIFFLVMALASRRSRIERLAQVLVYAALAHAVVAVLLHLGEADGEYFGTRIPHGAQASGTYANRNHFAGYLEMMLAIGIGLLIAGLSDRTADSWTKLLRQTLEWILSPKMLLRIALCILVIALTTTRSRMGNTAFFASLLVAGLVGIALSRRATRNTVVLLASLVVIDLAIVGSWFGVEKLARRLEETTMVHVQERENPAAHTIPLVRDYPVFGTGPGTFYVSFPRYRPEKIVHYFDYAHNDYAQFAAESGLAGFALIGLFVLVTLGTALAAQWRRRDPLMRGMSFACVMGVVAILIHSTVDFNLQIPANACFFMVLLALGWISFHHDRRGAAVPAVRAEAG